MAAESKSKNSLDFNKIDVIRDLEAVYIHSTPSDQPDPDAAVARALVRKLETWTSNADSFLLAVREHASKLQGTRVATIMMNLGIGSYDT